MEPTETTAADNNFFEMQSTTDYDIFQILAANRDANKGHINSLKKAWEEDGNLTKVQPVLVNENMYVIDGQHRLQAGKELHQEVFYRVVPGLTVADARKMNILHRSWKAEDYAKTYAAAGNQRYQRYIEFRREYGFNHSSALAIIYGGDQPGMFGDFQRGELVAVDPVVLRQRASAVETMVDLFPVFSTKPYIYALMRVMKVDGFSFKKFVEKSTAHGEGNYRQFQTPPDVLRAMEEVYNKHIGEENRVRLY